MTEDHLPDAFSIYPVLGPVYRRRNRSGLPDAPVELQDLICDALMEHGPDGHNDGYETIAALAWDWMKKQPKEVQDG